MDEIDKFEEVVLPEGREDYNTKLCPCRCHKDTQDEKLLKRSGYCACSLKVRGFFFVSCSLKVLCRVNKRLV